MSIIISPHAAEKAASRGTTKREIIEVLRSGSPIAAKYKRSGKAMIFPFSGERLGRFYDHKRVEVFYVQEGNDIIVITVYVFYGKWE
ncbi:MAG: DUF4258 domain-containing protein [Acidobacteriota bacterium]